MIVAFVVVEGILKKYVINGRFLAEKITGIQRYAFELTRELDKLVAGMGLEIYVPSDYDVGRGVYENIKVVKCHKPSSLVWEQVEYPRYLKNENALGINLCNVVPILYPKGIACIHDISYKVNPDFFKGSMHARLSRLWHCLNYRVICNNCDEIITVSEFSKREIIKNYRVNPNKITVVYNAWEHFRRDESERTSIEERYPALVNKKFYFSMCSLAKNKNIKWVLEAAQRHPESIFVISGMYDPKRLGEKVDFSESNNVIHLGYVSDDDAKLLMKNCDAFIFPTLYEGFGIPPLEALALGVDCIVSDTEVMHEVYGDAVTYINPYVYEFSLEKKDEEQKNACLSRFSWAGSAKKLYRLITEKKEQ